MEIDTFKCAYEYNLEQNDLFHIFLPDSWHLATELTNEEYVFLCSALSAAIKNTIGYRLRDWEPISNLQKKLKVTKTEYELIISRLIKLAVIEP